MAGTHQPPGLHPEYGFYCCQYQSLLSRQVLTVEQVWISPVVENLNASTADGSSYHGYWAQDIYEVNTNFGSAADLVSLSEALHKRGMV
jgi:glycosidase